MNQLTDDVKTLKDAGFISIARQYGLMARCLQRLQRSAKERTYSVYTAAVTLATVAAETKKALRRFEK